MGKSEPEMAQDSCMGMPDSKIGIVLAEKQVLFRIEESLLAKLDRRLAQKGYKTRNAWFKEAVKDFAGGKR